MKIVALIIAAGVGARTGNQVPKQFITVNEKPIVIYTLEKFQQSDRIDAIGVVCLSGWEGTLDAYARQHGIAKLLWIYQGGTSSQESIYNGLKGLMRELDADDIVVIHDGIRPMVDEYIIDSCIDSCIKNGNGISTLPVYEQVFRADSEETTTECIPRDSLRILQTPQAYRFGEILRAYHDGFSQGIGISGSSYANTLMVELGKTLYFADGSTKNIKITTADDIAIFKAMLQADRRNNYEPL